MKNPRVLLFDIETRYICFRGWSTGKQYVDQKQIIVGQDQDIICLAYKWLGDPKIHSLDWGLNKQDSSKMIEEFSKVVEQADIVLGYNSDRFDIRHINTQRLLSGKPPIDWPTSDDVFKQIKRLFYLPSYRLDYISKLLTGSGKASVEFNDWIEIVEKKSRKALDKMIKYNKRDVLKLEEVYNLIKSFLKPKLHVGLFNNQHKFSCPRCGDPRSQSKGARTTLAGKYQRRGCMSCGHTFKGARILPNS